jgi:hypothetical protein
MLFNILLKRSVKLISYYPVNSLILFLTISLCCATSFAQTFEGKIIYEATYKSKVKDLTDEQYAEMMGSTMTFCIKGGNNKTISNGIYLEWQIYKRKDNRIYYKLSNSKPILYEDASPNNNKVIKAELTKNKLTILGHRCDELILTCKNGKQKFYFNSKIKVDPKQYLNNNLHNWYDVVVRTNAVPLKMELDNEQFSEELLATSILEEKIDDEIFELPVDSKIVQAPAQQP